MFDQLNLGLLFCFVAANPVAVLQMVAPQFLGIGRELIVIVSNPRFLRVIGRRHFKPIECGPAPLITLNSAVNRSRNRSQGVDRASPVWPGKEILSVDDAPVAFVTERGIQ